MGEVKNRNLQVANNHDLQSLVKIFFLYVWNRWRDSKLYRRMF